MVIKKCWNKTAFIFFLLFCPIIYLSIYLIFMTEKEKQIQRKQSIKNLSSPDAPPLTVRW